MTFIHAYLLGGLVLGGLPVLLHLLQRPRPRRLPFPALRFLRARATTNRRKLRLQHLLLLLLRVAVVAGLCLALARPQLRGHFLGAGGDRPVAAVLVFDTSPSMGYQVAGQTRLEEAVRRARELLDEMAPESRVAVLDAGEAGGDALLSRADARALLEGLRVRPGCGPVSRALDRAWAVLRPVADEEDPPPRLVYLLSDRTRASWDAASRPSPPPEGVQAVYVDVGVEKPVDLSVEKVEVDPPVVAPGGRVDVLVTVRGTPGGHDGELTLRLDGDPADRPPERRAVKLAPGQTTAIVAFQRPAPAAINDRAAADVPYQFTASLAGRDALPFDDTRHATFLVRGGRRLLLIADREARQARIWRIAMEVLGSFRCDVKTAEEAAKLPPEALAPYRVVCLFQVPRPGDALWQRLTDHVRGGGGLAIVPPGEELTEPAVFSRAGAAVLPAALEKLADAAAGQTVSWAPFRGEHPLTAPFRRWGLSSDPDFARPELRPFVRRYWVTGKPAAGAQDLARYAAPGQPPALLEREVGKGLVLLFTTPLDARTMGPDRLFWHNYWQDSSFGLVLVDRVCRYLAGDPDAPELHFPCDVVPKLALPWPPRGPYALNGPDLAAAERAVALPGEGKGTLLPLPQATQPGNYFVTDGAESVVAGFSVDVRPEEADLDRVPVAEVEAVLGAGAVLSVGRSAPLAEALQAARPPALELLPYLMLAVWLALTVEGLVAWYFHRPAAAGAEGGAA